MLGAIIGDIVGSRFEWNNIKTKEFQFLTKSCFITDDSVMTIAIAKALLNSKINLSDVEENTIKYMQEFGRRYPDCGYGGNFSWWLESENPEPYNSFGNGAAMRVSACGWFARNLEMAKNLSHKVTQVTHNHKEGIKGAEAVTVAIYLAREGKTIEEIREYINNNYYKIDFTLDEIRDTYIFDVSCQGTVPYALEAFFESKSFEDAIRNAISIGGDSDTIAAITGSIAEAYYGIPYDLRNEVMKKFIPNDLLEIVEEFEESFKPKIIYTDRELLIEQLKKVRELMPINNIDADMNKAFYYGWEEAFNYVFALFEAKGEIKVEQGSHPETYIKRVKRKLND